MAILITGCAGFIGFSIAKKLLKEGEEIIGVDNFNSSYRVDVKHKRNSFLGIYNADRDIGKPPLYKCIFADTTNLNKMEEIFQGNKISVVIHLAARAGVRASVLNPIEYVHSNVLGFSNILECCRKYGVKKVVYASSSNVYSADNKLPFSEKDSGSTPISMYAASKRTNELMAHVYTHLYGIQTIGFRFFTVYGPWGRPDMAMWLFTEAIMKGKPIKVFNFGDMSRSFTYIDDVVRGIRHAVINDTCSPYEIINLGDSVPDKLLTMIEILEKKIGKTAKRDLIDMQPGDMKTISGNIKKAKNKLNWMPMFSLEEGIEKFVDWYKAYIYE